MIEYNRQKATEYAQRWALGANPDFYHFSGIGGDCTNFISQCLLAGGGKMNFNKYYGWFYKDVNNRSPSWTSVKFLERFLLSGSGAGPFGRLVGKQDVAVGDLIQLRQNPNNFNHTLFISKIENGQIYVCAHSFDVLNKPFTNYRYFEAKFIHIDGIRE